MDGASQVRARRRHRRRILILLINLIGGVAIGALMHDLSFGEAFRQYAPADHRRRPGGADPGAAAVGRGGHHRHARQRFGRLRSSRSASQLLASPQVLYSAAGVMVVLALIPGMPWLTFLTFAAVLGLCGAGADRAAGAATATSRWPPSRRRCVAEQAAANSTGTALPVVQPLPSRRWATSWSGLIDKAQGALLSQRVTRRAPER